MRIFQQELSSAQLEQNSFVLQEPVLFQKQCLFLFPLPKQANICGLQWWLQSLLEPCMPLVQYSVFRELSKPSVQIMTHQDNHLLSLGMCVHVFAEEGRQRG